MILKWMAKKIKSHSKIKERAKNLCLVGLLPLLAKSKNIPRLIFDYDSVNSLRSKRHLKKENRIQI